MGPIRDDTHASYASAFYRQLMVIHMLLMYVFCIYLLFVQVFFVVRTCASDGHLLLLIQVFIVVRTCASDAYASWTLASSCTSVFGRPYTCFQYMCFMDITLAF